ncbi:MAG: YbjN domain-containing protein [Sandaracinaceae bacterium]|nr:YbjN domain-containing protein [Sandaracinaceae bacterium]
MLTLQAIEEKLRARGWDPEPAEAEGTLHATHPTAEGSFPFYFRLSEDWLILSIVPFMRVDGRPSLELSRWLLRVNRDRHMAKFAYDEDGDIVLTAELPTASLSDEELGLALDELLTTAREQKKMLRGD